MALDTSTRGDGWFGFSPALVMGVAVVVLAASGFFFTSRGDVYVEALAEVCAKAGERNEAANAQTQAEKGRSLAIDWNNTAFHAQLRGTDARLADLQAVRVTGGHADDHRALLAGETAIRDAAAVGAEHLERRRAAAGTYELGLAMGARMKEQSRRFADLGLHQECPF